MSRTSIFLGYTHLHTWSYIVRFFIQFRVVNKQMWCINGQLHIWHSPTVHCLLSVVWKEANGCCPPNGQTSAAPIEIGDEAAHAKSLKPHTNAWRSGRVFDICVCRAPKVVCELLMVTSTHFIADFHDSTNGVRGGYVCVCVCINKKWVWLYRTPTVTKIEVKFAVSSFHHMIIGPWRLTLFDDFVNYIYRIFCSFDGPFFPIWFDSINFKSTHWGRRYFNCAHQHEQVEFLWKIQIDVERPSNVSHKKH